MPDRPSLEPMPGSKRRMAISVLLFVQAAMFGGGCVLTISFLVSRTGDPSRFNQLQPAIEQAAGFALSAILAVLASRGSRPGLYGTAAIAAFSTLIDLGFAAI